MIQIIFLYTYIVNYLPIGFIGLLLAAIIAASMSSTSAELKFFGFNIYD